jgi:hypothetical protein
LLPAVDIDNRKASVTECREVIRKEAFGIGPAVNQRISHSLNFCQGCRWVVTSEADESGYTTHRSKLSHYLCNETTKP